MIDWLDDVHFEPEERQHRGGQHVGFVPTGVWAIHETGIKTFCNSERSQHKNRLLALDMLEYGLREGNIIK